MRTRSRSAWRAACGGLLALVCGAGSARAEAASQGLAGAYMLRARGVEAASWNPATLAWGEELRIALFSVQASVRNNSFTLGDYNEYNGAFWDEATKAAILARISGSSIDGRALASATLPGVALHGWAFSVENRLAGTATVPKELARLILFGNDPREAFTLSGSGGEAIAWTEARLSHGREVGCVPWSDLGGEVAISAGLSAKLLRGWGYGEVLRTQGGLSTTLQGITGEADLLARTAEGGNGLGLDVGLAARAANGYDLAAGVQNALSAVWWTRETEEHRERLSADTISVEDLGDDGRDLVSDSSWTTPARDFRRSLPAVLLLAAGRTVGPAYLEVDLQQGFAERAGSRTTPRLAAGASASPLSWLETRAGVALGGGDGMTWAGGLGFAIWRFRLDLAVASIGRGNPFSPRGIGAGAALALDFSARRKTAAPGGEGGRHLNGKR